MVAFVAVQILSIPSDKLVQGSIALAINLLIYTLVFKIMNGIQKELMRLENISMMITVLLISLALLPAIFYPLHYLTQGYWSSFDNLLSTWPFQLLLNALCVVLNYFFLSRKKA